MTVQELIDEFAGLSTNDLRKLAQEIAAELKAREERKKGENK